MTYTAFPSQTDPPRIQLPSPWANPVIVDRLRQIWPTHSASQICGAIWEEFRIHVTRSAVVGKLHRLGLGIEAKIDVHPLTAHKVQKPRRPRIANPLGRQATLPRKPAVRHESPEIKAMRCAAIDPLNISITALTEQTCRWPYGDVGVGEGVVYCGHLPTEGRPYCGAHLALGTKPRGGV